MYNFFFGHPFCLKSISFENLIFYQKASVVDQKHMLFERETHFEFTKTREYVMSSLICALIDALFLLAKSMKSLKQHCILTKKLILRKVKIHIVIRLAALCTKITLAKTCMTENAIFDYHS